MDMLGNGLDTPGIIQLAGEYLHMDPTAYANLLDTIFKELDIKVEKEGAYCAYAMSVADEVAFLPIKDSGLRMDNVEEWMYQYFEKFVQANNKYSSVFSNI